MSDIRNLPVFSTSEYSSRWLYDRFRHCIGHETSPGYFKVYLGNINNNITTPSGIIRISYDRGEVYYNGDKVVCVSTEKGVLNESMINAISSGERSFDGISNTITLPNRDSPKYLSSDMVFTSNSPDCPDIKFSSVYEDEEDYPVIPNECFQINTNLLLLL